MLVAYEVFGIWIKIAEWGLCVLTELLSGLLHRLVSKIIDLQKIYHCQQIGDGLCLCVPSGNGCFCGFIFNKKLTTVLVIVQEFVYTFHYKPYKDNLCCS